MISAGSTSKPPNWPAGMRRQHEWWHEIADPGGYGADFPRLKPRDEVIVGLGEGKIELAKPLGIGGQPLVERRFHHADVFKSVD